MRSDWLKPIPPHRRTTGKRRNARLIRDLEPGQHSHFDMDDWEPSLLRKLLRAHNKLKR